jgi:hypothetical protein
MKENHSKPSSLLLMDDLFLIMLHKHETILSIGMDFKYQEKTTFLAEQYGKR